MSRSNGIKSLTVAGYFDDIFMGSSMIDIGDVCGVDVYFQITKTID